MLNNKFVLLNNKFFLVIKKITKKKKIEKFIFNFFLYFPKWNKSLSFNAFSHVQFARSDQQ